jgi:ribonuclease HI
MWQWGTFRGKRVLVRVAAPGKVASSEGRVDIRFQAGDSRTYPASLKNVTIDPKSEVIGDAPATPVTTAHRKPSALVEMPLVTPWIAYTDGACTGNPGPAGSGLVLLDPSGKLIKESYRYLGRGTNNVAELTAISMVFDHLPKGSSVLVHTDSKYAIGVLTLGWKAKANGDLIAAIKKRIAAQPTKMKYVPGHSGIALNERADELAREAIATRSSSE